METKIKLCLVLFQNTDIAKPESIFIRGSDRRTFFIDHGTGIVIGETSVIGNNVKIYQGVTLGALNVSKDKANKKRHPNIEDNVIIYSGATILGGDTTIGRDSIIGGNVWITQNVPSNSLVYNKSEIRIKDNNPLPESLTFVI